ncbi:MAG: DNA repair protein RadA, partial [Flavobacteriales bacterium]
MAKVKTTFFCQNCGTSFAKWQGQCSACKEWNTITEEVIQKVEKVSWKISETKSEKVSKSQKVKDISTTSEARLNTKNNELNRVLGGG